MKLHVLAPGIHCIHFPVPGLSLLPRDFVIARPDAPVPYVLYRTLSEEEVRDMAGYLTFCSSDFGCNSCSVGQSEAVPRLTLV